MSDETSNIWVKGVKKHRTKGIVIAVLCVLACKIPVVIALVGLVGLSSATSALELPPAVEMIGITLGVIGIPLLVGYLGYRIYQRLKL